jgi:hypothetical protein
MKDRELKNYIEKARKEAEKAGKTEEKEEAQQECEDEGLEFKVDNQEDLEKAEELARKYY